MRLTWSDIHLEISLWLQHVEFEDGSKREGLESYGSNSKERKGVLDPRQRQ